jgi:tripartite-type tricarboxylate transporter receptor subunit TctC
MNRRDTLKAIAALSATSSLGVNLSASAQTPSGWPNKPIRLINPFPAGGGTDAFARPFAAKLGTVLGQSIIVENMGGAGGTVGALAASRADADGYTFFVGAIHHSIAETLYPKRNYKLEESFMPITVLGYVPNVLVVHPKHPFKTEAELRAFAKANPGKLNYGSAGSGASHHIAGELYKKSAGVDMIHVPYKGIGPMMTDLLAGNVDLAFDGLASASSQIRGEKLRPLAVTSAERSPLLPQVPTMIELGFKEFQMTTWYALWAIKGTPQPIVDRVYNETVKLLGDADIKKIWEQQGAKAGGEPPKEFAKFISGEIAKWGKVVRDTNIKIDG